MFVLDSRLETASTFVADLPLCQARLQADARWPWMVLVPRRGGLAELEDLDPPDLEALTREIVAAGRAVRAVGHAAAGLAAPGCAAMGHVEKLNVGALGNVVAQLHIHVVGRRRDDPAWPGPVWGFGEPHDYPRETLAALVAVARSSMGM